MKKLSVKNVRAVCIAAATCICAAAFAQSAPTGPGGIGTTDGTSHLKIWLRADKGVFTDAGTTPAADGQPVQQWNDQSGNNLHAMQATSASMPVFTTTGFNGFPAISFNSGAKWLNAALNISPSVTPNITVLVVSSYNSFTAGSVPFSKLWGHDNGGYDRAVGFDPRASAEGFGYFTGAGVGDFSFIVGITPPNQPFVSDVMYTPNSFTGDLQGIGNGLATASNGDGRPLFTIGAVNSIGDEPWSGNIEEVIVYDTVLSPAQYINVENYLSAKYSTVLRGSNIYRMDDIANGYDYDVVGIHNQFNDPLVISTARGSGIVTLSNASNLFAGGSYFIGHDNASLAPVTTDLPTGIANRLGRTWAGTENDGDLGTMDLSFDLPELVVSDPANLRLLVDRNNNGSFADETDGDGIISGFTQSGNTYTINANMGDGQRFTIGAVSTVTLPVTLRSITGSKDGQFNKIQWKTDNETGFAYFDVQRSSDGLNFSKIGTVQASKNTGSLKEYTFTDNLPLAAIYYRLKIVDQKGQFTYSPVVKIITAGKRFTISPNPATSLVTITGLDGTPAQIELLDVNGKLLEQTTTTNLQQSFNLVKYPAGTYHIKVKTNKDAFTQTVIKQ